jgi:hypothetical protein
MPRTPITVYFTEECWRFLGTSHPEVDTLSVGAEVRGILNQAPRVRVPAPDQAVAYGLDMFRIQANRLLEYLDALYRSFDADDPRRLLCEQCLADVRLAIKNIRSRRRR